MHHLSLIDILVRLSPPVADYCVVDRWFLQKD